MTKEELKTLEEEALAAEQDPQAPGSIKNPEMQDYTDEIVCHADFPEGCKDPEEDE